MPIAFRLLIVLLAAIPALALALETFARHVTAFAAAIILATAALDRQADIAPVRQLLRRFSFAIVFPILWMTLQIVPLPVSSLANAIWPATSTALGDASLAGHVSVDPGATLQSLVLYLTMLALMVSATIVTRDRHRAETLLLVLSTVTTFMSAEVLVVRLDMFAGMIPSAGSAAAPFVAMSALAAIANGAILIMVFERFLSRRDSVDSFPTPLRIRLALGLCGLAVALVAMKSVAPGGVQAATAVGFVAMLLVVIVRRLAFRSWLAAALFVTLAGIAAAIILPRLHNPDSGAIEGFATSSAESLALARRAIADTPWLGNGVGTYRLLVPTYQDFGSAPALEPPSTAISIAIEWGKPALFILVAFAIQLFVFVFRCAVRRGRDAFFPSAAAGAVLVMLGEAFCDSSLLTTTVQIVVAMMVGLGLSQSVGRTSGLK